MRALILAILCLIAAESYSQSAVRTETSSNKSIRRINAGTDTVVALTSKAWLVGIAIGKPDTSMTITVTTGASLDTVAVIDPRTSLLPFFMPYDVPLDSGLVFKTTGALFDVTLIYRTVRD